MSRDTFHTAGRFALVIAAIGIVAFVGQMLGGCGASAIGAQADTIAITGAIVHEADEVIVAVRARELDAANAAARAECVPAGCDEARAAHHRAQRAAVKTKWAPVLEARDLAIEALHAWVAGLRVAEAASTDSVGLALLLRLGARVVALYGELVDLLAEVAPDVHLPGLPGELPGGGS